MLFRSDCSSEEQFSLVLAVCRGSPVIFFVRVVAPKKD